MLSNLKESHYWIEVYVRMSIRPDQGVRMRFIYSSTDLGSDDYLWEIRYNTLTHLWLRHYQKTCRNMDIDNKNTILSLQLRTTVRYSWLSEQFCWWVGVVCSFKLLVKEVTTPNTLMLLLHLHFMIWALYKITEFCFKLHTHEMKQKNNYAPHW